MVAPGSVNVLLCVSEKVDDLRRISILKIVRLLKIIFVLEKTKVPFLQKNLWLSESNSCRELI